MTTIDNITLPRAEAKELLRALRVFDAGAMIKAEKMLIYALAQQAEQVPSGKTCSNCTFHYKDIDMKPCGNCERGDNIEDNWMPMSTGQIALAAAPKGGV